MLMLPCQTTCVLYIYTDSVDSRDNHSIQKAAECVLSHAVQTVKLRPTVTCYKRQQVVVFTQTLNHHISFPAEVSHFV